MSLQVTITWISCVKLVCALSTQANSYRFRHFSKKRLENNTVKSKSSPCQAKSGSRELNESSCRICWWCSKSRLEATNSAAFQSGLSSLSLLSNKQEQVVQHVLRPLSQLHTLDWNLGRQTEQYRPVRQPSVCL